MVRTMNFLAVLCLLVISPVLGQHQSLNRPTGAPSLSPAPTMTPVPTSPSAAPTETTAPSPSPSAVPSYSPTGTSLPTLTHSVAPTDSPAPSPSPSAMPSYMPSHSPSMVPSVSPSDVPSEFPSVSPSTVPSATPSVSSAPSAAPSISSAPSAAPSTTPSVSPSEQPSGSPSAAPSLSSQPSVSPSNAPSDQPSMSHVPSAQPSVSLEPSSSPTEAPSTAPTIFHDKLKTVVAITFDSLDSPIQGNALLAFEKTTLAFLQVKASAPKDFTLAFTSVSVTEQTFIPHRRELATGSRRVLHDPGLRIRVNVTADIIPGKPPAGFSFTDTVSKTLLDNYVEYTEALEADDPYFGDVAVVASSTTDIPSDKVTAGKAAGIVVGAFAALAIAVGSAFYAIRHRDVVYARSVGSVAKDDDPYMIGHSSSGSTDATPYLGPGVTMNPTSPNSLEGGRALGAMLPRSYSISSGVSKDSQPSKSSLRYSESGGTGQPKSLLDTVVSADESKEEEADAGSLGSILTTEVLSAHSGKKDPPTGKVASKQNPPGTLLGIIRTLPSSCFSSDDDLSHIAGEDIDTPASNTSSLSSFTEFLESEGREKTLGARPMGESEQTQYRESHSTGSAPSMKKEGIYDVFAPPGPLGIVVDTTKNGPVIHSMKSSSPLLGLLAPGDLIIALDDMDTRGMTAATLTRMMAKRSHEKERKITLLALGTGSDYD